MHHAAVRLACLSLSCPVAFAAVQDPGPWSQFRGPGGTAVSDGSVIPTDFGPDRNVAWKVEVPAGHSSPCIVGERIFLTGFEGSTNVIVAIDRTKGTTLWSRSFEGDAHPQYQHVDAVPALPTACSDGERVFAYFGNYGVVALDLAGELVWEHRLPHPGYGFGVGTSPIVAAGRVILMRDGAPEAAILALNGATGEVDWKIDRFDYGESHGSPFLWRNADREELIIGGTLRLCSFDPANGKPLWTYTGITMFPCTTATGDADTLYFAAWSTSNATGRSFWDAGFGRSLDLSQEETEDPALLFARLDKNGDGHVEYEEMPECRAKDAFGVIDANQNGMWEVEELDWTPPDIPGKNLMVAISRGGEGDVNETHVNWSWKRGIPYVASPLLHRGKVWLFKAGGIVSCVDALSGEALIDRSRLSDRSEYYMSPVGAGEYVIAGSAEGTLYLIDADAEELSVKLELQFDEELFATPAVVDGTLFVRTKETLWAFATAKK